ncbi:MAG: hypothetical protein KKB37_15600 [Alphaproteobacteria bacterium]|nr:hypothetical protein [Alphaproteobacteria bacterium]
MIAIASVVLLGCGAAQAQTSEVIVDVDSTVALGCLDPFIFNISSDDLTTALTGGVNSGAAFSINGGSHTTTGTGSSLVVELPPITQALSGNAASYNLVDVGCIIQASPSFGQVSVRVTMLGNNVLQGAGGSEIIVNSVRARRSGTSAAFAASYSYPAFLHFFVDTFIEFQVNIDLRNASAAGNHSSRVPGTFRVQVTAP